VRGRSFTDRPITADNGEAQVQFHAEAKSNEITLPLVKAETTNFYK